MQQNQDDEVVFGISGAEHGATTTRASRSPHRDFPVLGGRATIHHFGTAFGDCAPRNAAGRKRCKEATILAERDGLVLPKLAFCHRLQREEDLQPLESSLMTPAEKADGFVLESAHLAVGIANGDCAVGVLSDEDGRLVVMHLGLACLYRDSGPTLLEQAVRELGASESLAFWVGAGIGPCCHAYDDQEPEHRQRAEMLANLYGEDVVSGVASKGPRQGQRAYDHVLMAVRLAEKLGVGRVDADRKCSACAGLQHGAPGEGYGHYFSNTRDLSGTRERNLVLVARADT